MCTTAEFEYRELPGQIFEQHLRYENSTNYYVIYTVGFALASRTQWYQFYSQKTAKNNEKCVIHLLMYCEAYNLIVAVSSHKLNAFQAKNVDKKEL
jgi:hypothetical protein